MSDDERLYKVIELVGSSPKGWEDAVQVAVNEASKSLRDIRNVTVVEMDAKVFEGKIVSFRTKVKLSFKYHTS